MPRPPPCPRRCPPSPPQPAAFLAPPHTWLAWRCPSRPLHLFCPRAPPAHIQEQRLSKPAFARCPPPPPPPQRQGREPICPVGYCTSTRYPPKKGAGECSASTPEHPSFPCLHPLSSKVVSSPESPRLPLEAFPEPPRPARSPPWLSPCGTRVQWARFPVRIQDVSPRAHVPDTEVQRKANAMHTIGAEGGKHLLLKASSPQNSPSPFRGPQMLGDSRDLSSRSRNWGVFLAQLSFSA